MRIRSCLLDHLGFLWTGDKTGVSEEVGFTAKEDE